MCPRVNWFPARQPCNRALLLLQGRPADQVASLRCAFKKLWRAKAASSNAGSRRRLTHRPHPVSIGVEIIDKFRLTRMLFTVTFRFEYRKPARAPQRGTHAVNVRQRRASTAAPQIRGLGRQITGMFCYHANARREGGRAVMSAKFVHAGTLAELEAKGRLIVRGSHRPILVVSDQGRVLPSTIAARIWASRSIAEASRTAF